MKMKYIVQDERIKNSNIYKPMNGECERNREYLKY